MCVLKKGFEILVSCGGQWSINVVLPGLLATPGGRTDLLGILGKEESLKIYGKKYIHFKRCMNNFGASLLRNILSKNSKKEECKENTE